MCEIGYPVLFGDYGADGAGGGINGGGDVVCGDAFKAHEGGVVLHAGGVDGIQHADLAASYL